MTQTISRWLVLVVLLTFTTVLPATAEEEQIYTIKKGDTLWDLSQRFVEDPYYWPNVWANNPEITNPHLIFPGQKIRILDGKLEIIPAYQDSETAKDEPAESLPIREEITIKANGSGDGFILTTEQPLGVLADSVDNRVLLSENDTVYVKMNNPADVTVGDTYGLYSRGERVVHPHTGKKIGTMMYNLGYLQVTELVGETVVAKIGKIFREVTRGAELFEYMPQSKELVLQPYDQALQGFIIASSDDRIGLGVNEIIYIDHGREDNLAAGNMLYISRPRQVSEQMLKQAGDLQLPDEVLGAAVVVETKNRTASAVIIKSANPINIGDQITLSAE